MSEPMQLLIDERHEFVQSCAIATPPVLKQECDLMNRVGGHAIPL